MKKWLKALAVVVILVILVVFVKQNNKDREPQNDKPVVKIGVSLPLTGMGADSGLSIKEGAVMALEEWKDKDTKFNYVLIIEDDPFSQKPTSMVGNKLINLDKVNALTSVWNLSMYQYKELVRKANIPYVACSWGNDTHDGKLIFNNQTPHSEHVRSLVKVLKKYNAKTAALVGALSNGDVVMHEYVENALKDAGIDLVFKEVVHYGTNDYRILIQKMKQKNPDVVISMLMTSDLMSFTKQFRSVDTVTPQTTVDYFDMVDDKSLFEGMYFSKSSTGTDEYKDKLAKRIDYTVSDCMASAYDNINLLIHAFENAKAEDGKVPTTEEVVKVLHTIKDWDGAIGKISAQEDGRFFSRSYVAKVENGKVVIVE